MRELLTYLAMFQVVLSVILYVCIVVKWHVLKSRIKANSWEQASPCGLQILDDAARYTKEETGNHLNVQIGPMRFTFSESV